MCWMRRRHWRPHGRKWTSEKDSLLSHLQLYHELVWLCLFVHYWGHSIKMKISVRLFLLLNVLKSTIELPDWPLIVLLSASAGAIIVPLGFTSLERWTVCLIDWNHLTCACAIDDKEDWLLKKLSLLSSGAHRDFGSIFSMLLPETMAKLEPPEGGDFMDGLEVCVAFGGVWKQSLSELSGGQRSLLALSLILALLLFKPVPLYILDEVCYLFVPTIPVV